MTLLVNSFAGGTNGVAITPGNSGGISGNAFDSVNQGSGITYDNSQTHISPLSANCNIPNGTGCRLTWSTSLGSGLAQVWIRAYVYLSTVTSLNSFWVVFDSGGDAGYFAWEGSKLQLLDSSQTAQATSATVFPANQWFRIEGYIIGSAAAGQLQAKIFLTPDAATPTETITTASTINTKGLIDGLYFGSGFNFGTGMTMWLTELGASTTGFIGPVPLAAAAAPVLGGGRSLLKTSMLWADL